MKQPEWQRGGICGALSSTSQQLNLEPTEQRERERDECMSFLQGSNKVLPTYLPYKRGTK